MSAAIVLQGLFVLVCHSNHTCDILIPHTAMTAGGPDVHQYLWGVGVGPLFGLVWNGIPMQTGLPSNPNSRMTLGMGELTSGPAHPFHRTYSDLSTYSDHQFELDGTKLSVGPSAARNAITIPWPDYIFCAGRVTAPAADVVHNSTDAGYILSKQDPTGSYLFVESTILYYNTGSQFTLLDENKKQLGSSSTYQTTAIMVLSSWLPPGGNYGDHSGGTNALLSDKERTSYHPSLQVTGIATVADAGDEPEVAQLGLPTSVILPMPQTTRTLMTRDHEGKMKPTIGHRYLITGTVTGCGLVSIEDGGTN